MSMRKISHVFRLRTSRNPQNRQISHYMYGVSQGQSGTREPGGPGVQLAPPTLEQGGRVPPQLFARGATRGIGDSLLYKAFHEVCCKVNRNFAVKL